MVWRKTIANRSLTYGLVADQEAEVEELLLEAKLLWDSLGREEALG